MNNKIIGKVVDVIIDRPLGTYHPEHKELYYPINYGYIEDIIAADGEGQDCYILGVDKPLKKFRDVVSAIIHRKNDVEDKWIVTPRGCYFTKEEIIRETQFMEKYFDIEIITI